MRVKWWTVLCFFSPLDEEEAPEHCFCLKTLPSSLILEDILQLPLRKPFYPAILLLHRMATHSLLGTEYSRYACNQCLPHWSKGESSLTLQSNFRITVDKKGPLVVKGHITAAVYQFPGRCSGLSSLRLSIPRGSGRKMQDR